MPVLNLHTCVKGTRAPLHCLVAAVPAAGRDAAKIRPCPSVSCGTLALELPAGDYRIEISAGLGFIPRYADVSLVDGKDSNLEISLERWVDFHAHGLFTGDCHNHVNFPHAREEVANFAEATGLDYVSLCQGWLASSKSSLGSDGSRLSEFISGGSTGGFALRMGAELPKTRFGHICWWRFPPISDPYGCYDSYHDSEYFKTAGIKRRRMRHPSLAIPYTREAPVNKLLRWRSAGGVSMSPHPTSWWKDNPEAPHVCTNIAVDYCFCLLAGEPYDTLVVMGYDPEQIFYQNLWFKLLNEGYRIAAVAETDGGLLPAKHHIGQLRSYAMCGRKDFDLDTFLGKLCQGASFMTSGPVLLATVDNGLPPGSTIRPDGEEHVIDVEAWSHPDPEEFISLLVLYRNGQPDELVDLRDKKPRHVKRKFHVRPGSGSREWFVVKAYGAQPPEELSLTNISEYCERCESTTDTRYTKLKQVAFTNPFYFEPGHFTAPSAIMPPLDAILVDSETALPIAGATVRVFLGGKLQGETLSSPEGKFRFPSVHLFSEFHIKTPDKKAKVLSIYLDYPPLRDYFESIYYGGWAAKNPNLRPGQVPWSVFRFDYLRKMLGRLRWKIKL